MFIEYQGAGGKLNSVNGTGIGTDNIKIFCSFFRRIEFIYGGAVRNLGRTRFADMPAA